MSGSALVHVKQKKKQSSSDHTLSMDCDSQLSPLRLLHQPTCHFCGLFGKLLCFPLLGNVLEVHCILKRLGVLSLLNKALSVIYKYRSCLYQR